MIDITKGSNKILQCRLIKADGTPLNFADLTSAQVFVNQRDFVGQYNKNDSNSLIYEGYAPDILNFEITTEISKKLSGRVEFVFKLVVGNTDFEVEQSQTYIQKEIINFV